MGAATLPYNGSKQPGGQLRRTLTVDGHAVCDHGEPFRGQFDLSVGSNGGSLNGQRLHFQSGLGRSQCAGSTLGLTDNTFGGTLYCPLTYVTQLQNNSSFGVVDINGGTLSQNVTLNVLGSGMTDSSWTAA